MTLKEAWSSSEGRASEGQYWVFCILPYICVNVWIVWFVWHPPIGSPVAGHSPLWRLIFTMPFHLVIYSCVLNMMIKRLHDRGKSGWYLLYFLVPFYNLWQMLELAFARGDRWENRFGPDPLAVPVTGAVKDQRL